MIQSLYKYLKDIQNEYHLSLYQIRKLVELNKVYKTDEGYLIDSAYFSTFNLDTFTNELKKMHYAKVSESRKTFLANKENRQKMSKALKKAWSSQEKCNQRSKDSFSRWSNPELRKKHSEICKKIWSNPELRERQSEMQKKLWSNPELHKRHSEICKKIWSNPELRKKQSEIMQQIYLTYPLTNQQKVDIQEKRLQTLKTNNSFSTSKDVGDSIVYLSNIFTNIEQEVQYPNSNKICDLYIKDLDLWIELHFCHYHNYKPFTNSKNDLEILDLLKKKSLELQSAKHVKYYTQYDRIIDTWTKSDVEKKELAKSNNLNWIAFYSKEDLHIWICSTFDYTKQEEEINGTELV
jgi:hypothetical protein